MKAWEPVADVWAEVVGLTGDELFTAKRIDARVSYRVTIRAASPAPAADWLIEFPIGNGTADGLNVAAVVSGGGSHGRVSLMCWEGRADG